jgi:phosphoesterase RecJ-like protein
LALLVRALHSLELLGGGQVALMTLWQRDFAETGANDEETERFVDMPQVLANVRVAVLAAEQVLNNGDSPRLRTRLSFRSKPGAEAVNVAELAERFGGGGHARAAGAKVDAPLAEVLPGVREALERLGPENG